MSVYAPIKGFIEEIFTKPIQDTVFDEFIEFVSMESIDNEIIKLIEEGIIEKMDTLENKNNIIVVKSPNNVDAQVKNSQYKFDNGKVIIGTEDVTGEIRIYSPSELFRLIAGRQISKRASKIVKKESLTFIE